MISHGRKERRAIALLIQQVNGQYQSAIWRGMSAFASSKKLDLFILDGRSLLAEDPTEQALNRVFSLANSSRIDGIITIIGSVRTRNAAKGLGDYRNSFGNKSHVNLTAHIPSIPCVLSDNRSGIWDAVEHLCVFHGRKKIAFLRGPETNFEAEERFDAFRKVLASLHIPFDPSLAFPGDFNADSGRILAEALSRNAVPRFDALVAANDAMAIGFQLAAAERGIRVPDDVALTGFDDEESAVFMSRPLSTIHQPFTLMCRTAGEMLLSLMDGSKTVENKILPARFIIRESCGCLPDSRLKRFETFSPGFVTSVAKKDSANLPHAESLFHILETEASGKGLDGTFCAALYDIISSISPLIPTKTDNDDNPERPGNSGNPGYPGKSNLTHWSQALIQMRERSGIEAQDSAFAYRKEALIQEGQLLIAHMLERKYASDILSLKNSLTVMNDFSRSTSDVRTTESLSQALDRALPGTGIRYAAITLPEARGEGTSESKGLSQWSSLRYLFRSGQRPDRAVPVSFPTLSILPDEALPSGSPIVCNVLPLAEAGTLLGFIFFDSSHPDASIYELFRSQISSNLGRVKLMEALLEKETRERVEVEKMNALGTLVAGIAHEINTPIGICVTAVSHLDRILGDLREALASGGITRSGMEAFVSDGIETGRLLSSNISRSSALVSSFKKVAVDSSSEDRRFFCLKEYINDILTTLSPRLKHRSIRVTVDCPDTLEIDSYPGAFSQILSNLIVNSLVHGFDENEKGSIQIRFRLDKGILVWTYEDDGKGIPADIIAKVFEPFFTTSRATGGSGLGLHIVYNTVTAIFGGHIALSSVPSQGVKFTITIPVRQEEIRYERTK